MCSITSFEIRSDQDANASNITGTAIGPETHVRVRWQWITAHCLIVLGSVVFLVLTIGESRGKEQLFKSSVLVGYIQGLEGYCEDEVEDGVRDDYRSVMEKARNVNVELCRDGNGKLVFVHEGG